MKKKILILLAILFVVLLAVSAFLIIRLVGMAKETEASTETSISYEPVGEYAAKRWPNYQRSYDEVNQVLTLSAETAMTYDNACAYGANVYADETAPKTYLNQVQAFTIDIISHCGCPSLQVVLEYTSTDGKPIFSVCSDGTVWTCWEEGAQ